ncbi:hypothetical protein BJX76DRAFT_359628 [Aspergillus varians]
MVALVVLLLCAATTVLAQDNMDEEEYLYIDAPVSSAVVLADDFIVEWYYNFDYDGVFTLELSPTDATAWSDYAFSTTVEATDSSTSLPASRLSTLASDYASVFDMRLYTAVGGGPSWNGDWITQITLVVPSTATTTVTATSTATSTTSTDEQTPTPTATTTETPEEDDVTEDTRTGGLSTGTKAGIGVGASAGGLLLIAAVVFLIFRRRKRNDPPKTIREISAPGLHPAAFGSAVEQNKIKPPGMPWSGSVSGSARGSGERFELGG